MYGIICKSLGIILESLGIKYKSAGINTKSLGIKVKCISSVRKDPPEKAKNAFSGGSSFCKSEQLIQIFAIEDKVIAAADNQQTADEIAEAFGCLRLQACTIRFDTSHYIILFGNFESR